MIRVEGIIDRNAEKQSKERSLQERTNLEGDLRKEEKAQAVRASLHFSRGKVQW